MNTPSAVSVLIADDEASIRNGLRSAVESLDPNLQVRNRPKWTGTMTRTESFPGSGYPEFLKFSGYK